VSNYMKTPVLVPNDRIEEFYEFFADWLRGEPMVPANAPAGPTSSTELDHWEGLEDDADDPHYQGEIEAARRIWVKLSPRAKSMFQILANEPGRRFTAEELVARVGIPNGIYGVAGALAWPARHAQAVGYQLPILFEAGEAGQGASYWMPDEAAHSFRRVMDT
jgi:hypothetical protein